MIIWNSVGWGLLVPKGGELGAWVGASLLVAIQFADTITVGAIITAALVVIVGGVFTLRNNMRSFWRGLAEERAEKILALDEDVKEREQQIHDLQDRNRADMAAYADEQRLVRHQLKNELAAATSTLAVERAKTDLTKLMEQLAAQHSEALVLISAGLSKQDEIIGILAGRWKND